MPPLPVLVHADGVTPLRAATYGVGGAYLASSARAPEFDGWSPPATSADADLAGERGSISARGRDLVRNDALAAGHVRWTRDTAIGWGLRLQSLPDRAVLGLPPEEAQAKGREIEAIFREWAENPGACDVRGQMDFGTQTRVAAGAVIADGEAFGLALWLPDRQPAFGSRFATTLNLIEGDLVGNPNDGMDTATLRDGFELDAWGAPIAAHIRSAHPGDVYAVGFAGAPTWQRAPIRFPDGQRRLLHVFEPQRPGQRRGVSAFAPVMAELKMGNRLKRAELQSAVVNAIISAVLETPIDGQTLSEVLGGGEGFAKFVADRNAHPGLRLGIGPGGLIPRVFPGEQLKSFASSRPSAGYDPFMRSLARHVAVGLGSTYEMVMRDFSQVNYSSARASILEAWRLVLSLRVLITLTWCRPALDLVLGEAVLRGYVDLPGYLTDPAARRAWLRSAWLGPARGWVDPVKEVQAAAMRVALGISTLRAEAQDQGQDFDDLLDQIAAERQALAERGIVVPDISFQPAPAAADEPPVAKP